MEPTPWFDHKYSSGKEPTTQDILALYKGLNISLPERICRLIQKELRDTLYRLNREYSPSLEIIADRLLHELPFAKVNEQDRNEFAREYDRICEKYKGRLLIKKNERSED